MKLNILTIINKCEHIGLEINELFFEIVVDKYAKVDLNINQENLPYPNNIKKLLKVHYYTVKFIEKYII